MIQFSETCIIMLRSNQSGKQQFAEYKEKVNHVVGYAFERIIDV